MLEAAVVGGYGCRGRDAGFRSERRGEAEAGDRGRERIACRTPPAALERRRLGARAGEKHDVQARRVVLVVARLEGNERPVVQDGGIGRSERFAGACPHARRHPDLADLFHQSRIGSERRRRPFRPAPYCDDQRCDDSPFRGSPCEHRPSSEKVGPNVVFEVMPRVEAPVQIGLIETMRAREGRVPWLGRHLARLRASLAALGAPEPSDDLADLVRFAVGQSDRVVRLQLTDGHVEIATRAVNAEQSISVVCAGGVHQPHRHETTRREQFGRALANARRIGASDAVLVTADGFVAEGTAWNLFWWENGSLCTPAADLGILPGLGRRRVMEMTVVKEERVPIAALAGRSLFIANAVRGIVEISVFDGASVPRDTRTAELASAFWPD